MKRQTGEEPALVAPWFPLEKEGSAEISYIYVDIPGLTKTGNSICLSVQHHLETLTPAERNRLSFSSNLQMFSSPKWTAKNKILLQKMKSTVSFSNVLAMLVWTLHLASKVNTKIHRLYSFF